MTQFRFAEHTPDVYVKKSRDFQLFCAIFDCLFGALKYNIDSIRDVTDTTQCNERLLPLLQTKLGFFTKLKIPNSNLRTILKAFPTIVRNKGSLTGIQQAVQVYLKLTGLKVETKVTITNKTDDPDQSYIVDISVAGKLSDTSILTEILRYVIPAGYKLRYSYKVTSDTTITVIPQDTVNIFTTIGNSENIPDAAQALFSGLRPSIDVENPYSEMLGRVDTTFVTGTQITTELKDKVIEEYTASQDGATTHTFSVKEK